MLQKLPKVNRQLAEKLLEDSSKPGGRGKRPAPTTAVAGVKEGADGNPLGDPRFAAMFTDPDYEVEETSEEFHRLHPVLSHRDKKRKEQQDSTPGPAPGEEEVGGGARGVVMKVMRGVAVGGA